MPDADGHSRCVLCLGAAHVDMSSEICTSFSSHALQESAANWF